MLLTLGQVAAGIGVAAACAPISSSSAPAAPTSATGAAASGAQTAATQAPAQAKKGGTLTLGQIFPIQSTDPHPQSGNSFNFREAIFNTLVGVDEKQNPTPGLAESWTLADDGLGLTLRLRQGVKFHNGKDFTADEAKWNVDYAQDPSSKVQVGAQLQGVAATARDRDTLELRFPAPLPQIFSLLVGAPIIEPSSDIAKAVVGTGPFKLDSFTPGDQMRLVRNQSYWRQAYPVLDAYVIKIVPDGSSLVVNLESGAVDVIIDPPRNEAKRLASGATKVMTLPGPGNFNYLVSCADKPFTDKRVRQAMGLAIDRQRFADAALFGTSEPTYVVWPKSSPVWDASLDTGGFNLDKAKQLLADAGFPNGFDTKIQTARSAVPELTQFSQILQADLAKIGVNVTIEEMESNQWLSTIVESRFPALLAHSYAFGNQDPALLFTAHPFGTEKNASRFQSDEYKRLVDAARRERDQPRRIGLYSDITKLIKDEAFILPMANRTQLYALRAGVQGLRTNALLMPNFEEASVA